MMIHVAIVEDEQQIRESLRLLIDGSNGFSCRHAYSSGEQAIAELPQADIDIVLMDIHLPGMDGICCVHELKQLCPEMQFLMCTSFEDTESVFKALKAGATGYLTKTSQPARILDALVDAYNGGAPMSSHIARKVVASFHVGEENQELKKLTTREREILQMLSQGLRYKEIAEKLFISTETVRTHIHNIYEKLQVNSRTDALNKTYYK